MESYIGSNDIFVFPCVSRAINEDAESNLRAKLMSEQNITNIIKSITDKSSYIIEWTDKLKCVIDGYYFEISNIDKSGTKYAVLNFQSSQSQPILIGEDNDEFHGLKITDQPQSENYLTLCVNGEIPSDSYTKFKAASIGGKIDCGELK